MALLLRAFVVLACMAPLAFAQTPIGGFLTSNAQIRGGTISGADVSQSNVTATGSTTNTLAGWTARIAGSAAFVATAPTSATSTCSLGMISVDSGYFYACTAPNTWLRVAISTWSGSPSGSCPYSGYADGCSNAPTGTAQHPTLLTGYGSHRPPWNVAGVDYPVGIPSGTTLTDWQSISNANLSVNTSTGAISCTTSGASVTLNGIDFSLHGGSYVYNGAGKCSNITITNSNFACTTTAKNFVFLQDQAGATLVVKYNHLDGANCYSSSGPGGGFVAFIGGGPPLTFQYNLVTHSVGQVVSAGGYGTGALDYRFNYIDDTVIFSGAHMNYLQWGGSGYIATPTFAFNTTYQSSLGGAEGPQFYTNGSTPASFTTPVVSNNTMIAVQNGGTNTMSYMMHGNCHDAGSCATAETTLTGGGTLSANYFDASGAYGAFYTGTMTSAQGWAPSGNVDMNTGNIITPP